MILNTQFNTKYWKQLFIEGEMSRITTSLIQILSDNYSLIILFLDQAKKVEKIEKEVSFYFSTTLSPRKKVQNKEGLSSCHLTF